jgi:hypothetical protein
MRTQITATRTFRLGVVVAAVAGLLLVAPGAAGAATTVRPGDQLYSDAGQCTANFVYTNGSARFIGLAAHCFSMGGSTDTNGCDTASLPLGAAVENADGTVIGSLAYSSWIAMQQAGEGNAEACDYNDLALVRLASGVTANPSVPRWGGPTGLTPAGTPQAGNEVYSYGNSSLRLGITQLSPKTGFGVDDSPGGWSHTVYTLTPGIPGDSGSGFLDAQGRAFGTLSTVQIAPLVAANGVADLGRQLAYANARGGLGTITVVTGGAFTGGLPL